MINSWFLLFLSKHCWIVCFEAQKWSELRWDGVWELKLWRPCWDWEVIIDTRTDYKLQINQILTIMISVLLFSCLLTHLRDDSWKLNVFNCKIHPCKLFKDFLFPLNHNAERRMDLTFLNCLLIFLFKLWVCAQFELSVCLIMMNLCYHTCLICSDSLVSWLLVSNITRRPVCWSFYFF